MILMDLFHPEILIHPSVFCVNCIESVYLFSALQFLKKKLLWPWKFFTFLFITFFFPLSGKWSCNVSGLFTVQQRQDLHLVMVSWPAAYLSVSGKDQQFGGHLILPTDFPQLVLCLLKVQRSHQFEGSFSLICNCLNVLLCDLSPNWTKVSMSPFWFVWCLATEWAK